MFMDVAGEDRFSAIADCGDFLKKMATWLQGMIII
jgi:hypothetical protein